jgi:hypothetical protein
VPAPAVVAGAPEGSLTDYARNVSREPLHEPVEMSPAEEALTRVAAEQIALRDDEQRANQQHTDAVAAADATLREQKDEFQKRRTALEAERARLREYQALCELAEQTRVAEEREERGARALVTDVDEKNAQLAARLRPAMEKARAAAKDLQEFATQHRPTLVKLAQMSWKNTPASWPQIIRNEFGVEAGVAQKRLRDLDDSIGSVTRWLRQAEEMLARGWSVTDEGHAQAFEQEVNRAIFGLTAIDSARYFREELAGMSSRIKSVEYRGEANAVR